MVALPAEFLNNISFGLEVQEDYKIKRIKYGDNYSSRVADGINNVEEEWNISWDDLTIVEATALRAFWRARGGTESVQFTPPDYTEEISVVSISKLSIKYAGYNRRSCSLTVERVYDNA